MTAFVSNAEKIVRRVKYHVGPTGKMDEQFNRHDGYQLSAENLTWSYASCITMNFWRTAAAAAATGGAASAAA